MRHFSQACEVSRAIVAVLWSARAPIAQTRKFLRETKSQQRWRDTGLTCSWKRSLGCFWAVQFHAHSRAFLIGQSLQGIVQVATFLDVPPVCGNDGIWHACEVLGYNPGDFKTIEIAVTHFD